MAWRDCEKNEHILRHEYFRAIRTKYFDFFFCQAPYFSHFPWRIFSQNNRNQLVGAPRLKMDNFQPISPGPNWSDKPGRRQFDTPPWIEATGCNLEDTYARVRIHACPACSMHLALLLLLQSVYLCLSPISLLLKISSSSALTMIVKWAVSPHVPLLFLFKGKWFRFVDDVIWIIERTDTELFLE